MWEMHNGFGWWMVLGSVWFVVFWGLVIWAVVSITSRSSVNQRSDESALEILKRRYARGEITRDEFERMRQDVA